MGSLPRVSIASETESPVMFAGTRNAISHTPAISEKATGHRSRRAAPPDPTTTVGRCPFDAICPGGNQFARHRRPGAKAEIRKGRRLDRVRPDCQSLPLLRTIHREDGGSGFLHCGLKGAGLAGSVFHRDTEGRPRRQSGAEELHLVDKGRQNGHVGAVHQHARFAQAAGAARPVSERRIVWRLGSLSTHTPHRCLRFRPCYRRCSYWPPSIRVQCAQ